MGKENLCPSSQSTNWEDFRSLGFGVSDINGFTGTSKYKEIPGKSQPPVESDKPSEQLLVYVLERMSVKETVPNAEGFLFQIEKPFISQIEIKVRQPLSHLHLEYQIFLLKIKQNRNFFYYNGSTSSL